MTMGREFRHLLEMLYGEVRSQVVGRHSVIERISSTALFCYASTAAAFTVLLLLNTGLIYFEQTIGQHGSHPSMRSLFRHHPIDDG